MTKNEILEYFKDINYAYNDCTRHDTLKRMLDELQEPCTDAISREAVKNIIRGGVCTDTEADIEYVCGLIDGLPPVTPVEKVGYWITLKDEDGYVREAICSNCGRNGTHKWAFCPDCGSKMQEVEE